MGEQNKNYQFVQERDPNQDADILKYPRDQEEFKNIPTLN